jgi:hypothetical protein
VPQNDANFGIGAPASVGNQIEESAMTKLLAISAFVGVAYLFDPGAGSNFDTQMRILAYRINSALDVSAFLGGR